MRLQSYVLVVTLVASGIVFGTAVLAGAGAGRPTAVILADPEGTVSDAHFDGRTAVWIEVGGAGRDPRAARLAVRPLDAAGPRFRDLAGVSVDPADPLGWLAGGPRVDGGTVVFATRDGLGGAARHALKAYDLATGALTELATGAGAAVIREPDVRGRTVAWADGRGADLDIWAMDLDTKAAAPLVADAGNQSGPALSADWVVWLTGQPGDPVREVRARRRSGATVSRTLNPGGLAVAVAIDGARVAWVGKESPRGTFGAWLYDLGTGRSGRLAAGLGTLGGIGLSRDWILFSTPRGGPSGEPGAPPVDRMPGELVAYDATAVTSLNNLERYLPGTVVAYTTAPVVAPAVAGAQAVWAEPDDGARGHATDRRVMRLFVVEGTLYLPRLDQNRPAR